VAKVALLIGVSEYREGLKPLPAALKDVAAMQEVLQNPEMGGFDEVKPLINPNRSRMEEEIEIWLKDRQPDDLLLLFFSGHGVKDESRELYFATCNTRKDQRGELIKSTAVPASFVRSCLKRCKSKRQVVILDCCFSGAFGDLLAKDDGDVDLESLLGTEGGVVLTSSSSLQYSFEQKGSDLSIYTRYLVEGIRTGAADQDGDGAVSVDELHQFASKKVQEAAPAMTPKIIVLKDEGYKIKLAKAPTGDPKLKYREEAKYQKQRELERHQQQQAQETNRQRQQQSTPTNPSKSLDQIDDLSSERGLDYTNLRDLLASGQWKEADRETLSVMLRAVKRERIGYLDTMFIEQFPCKDLRTIDRLWVKYSNGCFGFSVQRCLWESGGGKPGKYDRRIYRKFGERVGWLKWENKWLGLKKEEQWLSYSEINFDLNAPQGHLPRAWAGRGENWRSMEMGTVWEIEFVGWGIAECVSSLCSRVETCKL
jgi:uncharacterized caspase-like protein